MVSGSTNTDLKCSDRHSFAEAETAHAGKLHFRSKRLPLASELAFCFRSLALFDSEVPGCN